MLTDLYTIRLSGDYAAPRNQNDPIPVLYGALTENSDGPVSFCPCIDTAFYRYAIAGHAVQSAGDGNTFTVYANGVEVTSGYTIDPAYTDELGNTMAILTFGAEPTEPVTIRCNGKVVDGVLLTNPVDIVLDILDEDTSTDAAAIADARSKASLLGYTCAGVIMKDIQMSTLIASILRCFLGDWYLNNDGRFVIRFDAAQTRLNLSGIIPERYTTPANATRKLENIVNQVQIDYAVSMASLDKRFKTAAKSGNYYRTDDGTTTKNAASQSIYGVRLVSLQLDWTRSDTTVAVVQARLIARLKDPVYLIDLGETHWGNVHVEKGDYLVFSCGFLMDEDELPLQNQVGRAIEVEKDLDANIMKYLLQDTGRFYPAPPDQYDGDQTYGDGGYFGGNRLREELM